MKISKETSDSLMNVFAAVYMDTHETTGIYETDKENIENAARIDFLKYCAEKGIEKVEVEG